MHSAQPLLVSGKNLTIRHGRHTVFSELDFCLYRQEHLVLMGPNGIGKSTLLGLLGGFLFPANTASGSLVWEFGTDYNASPLAARKYSRLVSPAHQAKYVRQEWQVRGEEVVLAGFSNEALSYNAPEEAEKQQVHALAAAAGVVSLLAMPVHAMSQGQLRFILLLRALVANPKLLLLDEPYDGLSPSRRNALTTLLERAAEQGSTLVLTAHRTKDIPPFVRHLVVLENTGSPHSKHPACGFVPATCQEHAVYAQSAFHSREHRLNLYSRDISFPGEEAPANTKELAVPAETCTVADTQATTLVQLLFDKRPLCQRCLEAAAGDNAPAATGVPLLRMQHVDVYIDRTHVLKNLSWCMEPGQHWVVSGENGAGKSTLLRLLYGEEVAAYGGSILWCGQARPPLPFWRMHVGQVSDRLHIEYGYDLTALEVVLSGRGGSIGIYDEPAQHDIERAERLLRLFQVETAAKASFFALSSGQGRRVLLARAMMCSPALLLLDEPCSGLDPESRNQFFASLETLAAARVQLVYVTHHTVDIPALFTHELLLEEGQIRRCGARDHFALIDKGK